MKNSITTEKTGTESEQIIAQIEAKAKKTIKQYNLISRKDKVLVALSGGKDSTTCLHILNKLKYNIEAFTVDVNIGCYTQQNLENVRKLCEKEKVKLHIISFRKNYGHSVCHFRTALNEKGLNFNSCTICGVMRRRLYNVAAKQAGATKIATGHNIDDEAQSILMNLLKNKQSLNARIAPKQKKISKELVPRIKPLFFITEDEIIQYSKAMNFPVHYGMCPCASTSTRYKIRQLMSELKKISPNTVQNIVSFFFTMKDRFTTKKTIGKIKNCENCGEPATTNTCRSCQILSNLEITPQLN